MKWVRFILSPEVDALEARYSLKERGLLDIAEMEDAQTGEVSLLGHSSVPFWEEEELPFALQIEDLGEGEISWQEQWEASPKFREGLVQVDLSSYALDAEPSILSLQPGPGFGDLSHPTTELVLQLMGEYIKDQVVVDLGCGSGILALAASAAGAREVHAVDIDPSALQHAEKNAELNALQSISFSSSFPALQAETSTVLWNMISSEQEQVWPFVAAHTTPHMIFVVSGVLEDDAENYRTQALSKGWQLEKMLTLSGWAGFVFSYIPQERNMS